MNRRILLYTGSWPLSRFAPRRPGDRELADFVANSLSFAPAVLVDGVPFPDGPVIRRAEIPDPLIHSINPEDISLDYNANLPQLDIKRRQDAPFTYAALASLVSRYAKSTHVRLIDLLPPEWISLCQRKFPDITLVGEQDRERERRLLRVQFLDVGQFDSEGLVVVEAPEVPLTQGEMSPRQLADAAATGEPRAHVTVPPEIVECITITPINERGQTLGGSIPQDLWKIFKDAPEDEQYLHEVLGIADSFCHRYDRETDAIILKYLQEDESAGRGYCEGNCLQEQFLMRDWVDEKRWNEKAGQDFAHGRRTAVELPVENTGPWEMATARHQPNLQAELMRLELLDIPVRWNLQPRAALEAAYRDQSFAAHLKHRTKITRVWGFLHLMWLQLQSHVEEIDTARFCPVCGSSFAKKGTKTYCSNACKAIARAEDMREYRKRNRLKARPEG